VNGTVGALPHSRRPGVETLHVARRVGGLDWTVISRSLDDLGSSLTGPVLALAECKAIVALYGDDRRLVAGAVPRGRADPAYAALAALWARGLERLAPRPLR
jgi:hypothetical protein